MLVLTLGLVAGLAGGVAGASATPAPGLLPVVFVHGNSGSASQFATHAMRFTSNGYPQDLLFAFEYDTSRPHTEVEELVNAQLDAYLDAVLQASGSSQALVAAHSRGTTVMHRYLAEPNQAAKVARYVNLDGRRADAPPGGVPTLAVWGEWNPTSEIVGAVNAHFDIKGHTEVATAAETFALMYEFFTGSAPRTTDVVPESPDAVTIAGRATLFPQNTGAEGTTLEVHRVDPRTGQRHGNAPMAVVPIDAGGAWGPLSIRGDATYELALVRDGGSVHHFYQAPFARSDHFVRLQTSLPGQGIAALLPGHEATSSFVISRMREWWAGQPEGFNDRLTIDGVDVVTPATSPRQSVTIALLAYDDEDDGVSDPGKGVLPPFGSISFLTAVDVAVPASPVPDRVVPVTMWARGEDRPVTVNVANWPSSGHRISIAFRDHVQGAYTWHEYVRGLLTGTLR